MSDGNPAAPSPSSLKIPENLWIEFTPAIQSRVAKEYLRIKPLESSADFVEDETVLWTTAILSFLRTISPIIQSEKPERTNWIRENITGLMFVTTLLTVTFGVLGAWGLSASADAKTATSGFLDIAKLFAGALVGAAGAAGVSAAAKK
jgi:hypothetical protein